MVEAMSRAPRSFFRTDPSTMAIRLLGQRLVRVIDGVRLAGTIVETEAYLGKLDKAAHSFGGRRTARTETMYADAGTLYVYFTYGMHHCMNVVCGREDEPVAVLIRALAPTEGLERMRANRMSRRSSDKVMPDTALCSGPAKACQALGIDRTHDAIDLAASETIFIERIRTRPLHENTLVNTPRIGVAYAGEWADRPLRWYVRDSAHISTTSASGAGADSRRSRVRGR
jgi:DNA-3-methyladenine glycosylase